MDSQKSKQLDSAAELEIAALAALEYLSSPNFPHKSPLRNDRKPAAAVLRAALARRGIPFPDGQYGS